MKLPVSKGALALSVFLCLASGLATNADWTRSANAKIAGNFVIPLDGKHELALQVQDDQMIVQFSKSSLLGQKVGTEAPFVCTISEASRSDHNGLEQHDQVSLEITLGDEIKAEMPSLAKADHLQLDLGIDTNFSSQVVSRVGLVSAVDAAGKPVAMLFHDFVNLQQNAETRDSYPGIGDEGSYFANPNFKCR